MNNKQFYKNFPKLPSETSSGPRKTVEEISQLEKTKLKTYIKDKVTLLNTKATEKASKNVFEHSRTADEEGPIFKYRAIGKPEYLCFVKRLKTFATNSIARLYAINSPSHIEAFKRVINNRIKEFELEIHIDNGSSLKLKQTVEERKIAKRKAQLKRQITTKLNNYRKKELKKLQISKSAIYKKYLKISPLQDVKAHLERQLIRESATLWNIRACKLRLIPELISNVRTQAQLDKFEVKAKEDIRKMELNNDL